MHLFILLLAIACTFLSSVDAISSQISLCKYLMSPVTFKIPTFVDMDPIGNSNGLYGQAKMVFRGGNSTSTTMTGTKINLNVCPTVDTSIPFVSYIDKVRFTTSIDQDILFTDTQNLSGITINGDTNCVSGSISITEAIPRIEAATTLITIALLDDRNVAYAVYYINGVEEIIASTPPTLPVLN